MKLRPAMIALAWLVVPLSIATVPAGAAAQSPAWNGQGLAADRRAARVGDSLTVLIVEASSATASAQNGSQRQSRLGGRVGSDRTNSGASAAFDGGHEGRGQIARSGRLLGQIGAVVERVLPNGDLWIRGQQSIDIDGQITTIRLSGRVRPSDISGDNDILSSRLSEAEIFYESEGSVSRSGSPGLFQRLFSWLGLP